MKFKSAILGIFLIIVGAGPAYAYLDPGTGSMIVQAVIGAFAAVGVTLGIFRKKIASFFHQFKKSDKSGGKSN